MLVGKLRVDALGLVSSLEATHPQVVSALELTYSAIYDVNTFREPHLGRTDGASYNPRPARVCQILIKEVHEREADILCAAMRRSVGLDDTLTPQPNEQSAERIALAIALDDVRHVHQLADPHSAQQILDRARVLLEGVLVAEQNSRLQLLLSAAYDRTLRNMRSREP